MKKGMVITLIVVLCLGAAYFFGFGFSTVSSAYIESYEVSEDGTEITLCMGVSSSMGYIRKLEVVQQESGKLYLKAVSAFGGLNGSVGAKEVFTIPLEPDTDSLALARSSQGAFEVVLEKTESGQWIPSEAEELPEYFAINVPKIGQADAIILNTPSSAVLIDTGEDDDGGEILEKVSDLGIEKFDYLILTHYDKDHVGGAAEIIDGIEIGEIIEPGYEKDSKKYNAFEEAAEEKQIPRTVPTEDISFELDGVSYEIMMPKKDFYENENNHSIIVKTTYGERTALFMGDALDERMREVLGNYDLSADILKVSHHGSFEMTSEEVLEAVQPQYSMITCSKKNPAETETLENLNQIGSKIYLTSDGDITMILTEEEILANQ